MKNNNFKNHEDIASKVADIRKKRLEMEKAAKEAIKNNDKALKASENLLNDNINKDIKKDIENELKIHNIATKIIVKALDKKVDKESGLTKTILTGALPAFKIFFLPPRKKNKQMYNDLIREISKSMYHGTGRTYFNGPLKEAGWGVSAFFKNFSPGKRFYVEPKLRHEGNEGMTAQLIENATDLALTKAHFARLQ